MMVMMSRTVRYFKLMYIVAGILTSNAEICETVDQIQIAPRVEVQKLLEPRRVYHSVERVSINWFRRFYLFGLSQIKRRLKPIADIFSIRNICDYLIDRSTNYISPKLVMSSDCDAIYK